MNMEINPTKMRKKTEVENNLLQTINCDLKEYVDDLEFVQKFYKFVCPNYESDSEWVELIKIFVANSINSESYDNLIKKIFENSRTIYYAFQYFYLKKSDFMGMNLTGLINGKMETGIGFRNSLKKLSNELVKKYVPTIYTQIQLNLSNPNSIEKMSFYQIKSDQINWKNQINQVYKNFLIVANYDTKEYFIFGQI